MNIPYYTVFTLSPWFTAIEILSVWILVSVFLYYLIGWIFQRTGIEKFMYRFLWHSTRIGKDPLPKAVGRYIAIFVFLLFLRSAVERAGYLEIEQFLDSVVDYLPHLLLALLITFFGIQSSRTSYTLVYNAAHFENPRTAVILAQTARIVIIFFTFTIVINQINTGSVQIIPEYLVRSVLIGFVAAASLAFGLAFGLGGQAAAKDIIQEYMHHRDSSEKDLKK